MATDEREKPVKRSSDNKVAVASPTREKKLGAATWILLGSLAVVIDLAQGADFVMTLGTLGTVLNMLADIVIGLSLTAFFWWHKMLDWKLGVSLLFGFAVDFVTAGVAPAWFIDILYAWLVTDGASVLGALPLGEIARQAALTTVAKSKKIEFRGELSTIKGFKSSLTEEYKRSAEEYSKRLASKKTVDGIRAPESESPPLLSP